MPAHEVSLHLRLRKAAREMTYISDCVETTATLEEAQANIEEQPVPDRLTARRRGKYADYLSQGQWQCKIDHTANEQDN